MNSEWDELGGGGAVAHPLEQTRAVRRVGLAALCSVGLLGCVLLDANRNNKTIGGLVTVKGTLVVPPHGKPVFAVLLHQVEQKGWQRQSSRVLYEAGAFEFLASPGHLQVFAFVDLNGDHAWSEGEPSASSREKSWAAGATFDTGELEPVPQGQPPAVAIDLRTPALSEELVKVHRGDACTLAEARFTEEAATMGFWRPADFAIQHGVGVSFLQPYDAKKVPVLFVHGAQGTPVHFRALIDSLDRSRFQPWVYSYPSGIRLELAASTLKRIVDDLQLNLGFERVVVVAHSMGGLVARSFTGMVAAQPEHSYVRMLVTLSSPFGGHEDAQTGVDHAPVVLPCWLDMASGSPFLKSLRTELPPAVPHHLLFSYVGGARSDGPTDGTVSVRSMLSPEVQAKAASVTGYPETHMTILESPEALRRVNALLAQAAATP